MNADTRTCRGEYSLACPQDECIQSWHGDDLAAIAKSVAYHWNKKHNSDLKHGHEQIDTLEVGGHHIQGNEYAIKRIPIYLTSFDVMDRIGQIDGYAVRSDPERVCSECLRKIPNAEDRIEDDPDDAFNDDWNCRDCIEESEIEQKANENQQITEWTA